MNKTRFFSSIQQTWHASRLNKVLCTIFALFVAAANILGFSSSRYGSVFAVFNTHPIFGIVFFAAIMCVTLFITLMMLTWAITSNPSAQSTQSTKTFQHFKNLLHRIESARPLEFFFGGFVTMTLLRLPFLIWMWPGNLATDQIVQLAYGAGILPLSTYHSVLGTKLYSFVILPFVHAHATYLGIGLFSLLQILFLDAAIMYAITTLKKQGIRPHILVLLFLFFSLFPIFSNYAVTLWGNVLFAMPILVSCTFLLEFAISQDRKHGACKLSIFGAMIVLVYLLRPEGPLVALSIVASAILLSARRKQTVICVIVSIICAFAISSYFNTIAEPGPKREAFSVPLQQIALVVDEHQSQLTPNEKRFIADVFPKSSIVQVGDTYQPNSADPIKNITSEDFISEKTGTFLTNWFKLGLRFPGTYIKASLEGTTEYWSLLNGGTLYGFGILPYPKIMIWGLNTVHIPPYTNLADNLFGIRNFLGYVLYALGFWLYLGMGAAIVLVNKFRSRRTILAFLPLVAVFSVCLISPVNGYWRYGFPYVLTIPFMLAMAFDRRFLSTAVASVQD